MATCIMVGCDLHDKSMLLRIAVDRGQPVTRSWATNAGARKAMMADLWKRAGEGGAPRITFVYEACGFGFRFHDELTAAGIESYVVAPSRLARSAKHRKGKTDEKDAQALLEVLRAYVLAGSALPAVWVPDVQTRDDRELVRRRLAIAEDQTKVKARVRWLLKRSGIEGSPTEGWTQAYWVWLQRLAGGGLPGGAAASLASHARHLEWLWQETERLDEQIEALSRGARYAGPVEALCRHKGVGLLTAMVYLTEMGDLSRFANRRQVGSFLGLVPCSYETGQGADRKGHITHQGPARVRKVLCQAIWSRVRWDEAERVAYERLVARNPKHKKIAVVARMRALAIRLWHDGLAAQKALAA